MKNVKVILTFLAMVLICYGMLLTIQACTTPLIEINTDTQKALIKAAARRAGQRFYFNNPGQGELAISHCNTILESENPQDVVKEALTHLKDPFLEADIADLISLIKIDVAFAAWDREKLLLAVESFKEGIEMAIEMPAFRRINRPVTEVKAYNTDTWDPAPPWNDAPGMFNDDYFIDLALKPGSPR